MMKLLLDDQPCPCEPATVGEAIVEGAAFAQDQGRLVIEVVVDGVMWDDEALSSEAQANQTADEVRLISANRAEMVLAVLNDAIASLDQIDERQTHAADQLEGGDERASMIALGEALEMWSAIRQGIDLCGEVVPLRLDEPLEGLGAIGPILSDLADRLTALRDAIVRHDVVFLGDVLRYELPEVVERWRDLLRGLRDRVLEAPSAS
ncbi:MAG: hypothetical protein AAF432_12740 [Planctomycetota bacterium]